MNISKLTVKLSAACALLLVSVAGAADSAPTKLNYVRTLADESRSIIEMKTSTLGTTVFSIYTGGTSGKELFATALAAINSGKNVIVESGTCEVACNWGDPVKSIRILAD